MSKLMRFVSLFILLSVVLGACAPATTTAPEATAVPNDNTEATPEASGAIEVAPGGEFPIVNEKITLKVLVFPDALVSDYQDNEFTQFIEDKMNIHLEFTVAPADAAEANQKLNLMMASGDLPDIIMGWYDMTLDRQLALAEQGLIVPLNDYIDEYGVETKRVFAEQPGAAAAVTQVDGKIYSPPDVNECYHCTHAQKLWVYQPWLDKLGLEVPTTTEEFEAMLIAFKTQDPNGNGIADEIPVAGHTSWHGGLYDFLMNPFVYTQLVSGDRYFYLEDGKVTVPFNQDGWKAGLQYLNKLYDQGLIDPQSFTMIDTQFTALGENPDAVILGSMAAGHVGMFTQVLGPSGRWLEYTPISPIEGPTGLRQNPTTSNVTNTGHFMITSASQYPEAAFRLADYLLSFEGTSNSYFGLQGKAWEYVEPGSTALGLDGEPAIYNQMIADFSNVANNKYWYQSSVSFRPIAYRSGQADTPENPYEGMLYRWSRDNYAPYDVDKTIPPLVMVPEKAVQVGDLRTTIYGIVEENFASFVSGQRDIDTEWDAYLQELEDAGLPALLQLYQDAYDAKYK